MISESIMNSISRMGAFLIKEPVVRRVWLFGSCARGEESSESDVDLLVDYDRSHRPTLFTVGGIISNLEKIFGRRVDFVENGYLIPTAALSAEKDKILIYERKDS